MHPRNYELDSIFQSTLPREERHYCNYAQNSCLAFQSTLPREERQLLEADIIPKKIFQSTLPREERPKGYLQGVQQGNFNPRSHERSDNL